MSTNPGHIANERTTLSNSLWAATANETPPCAKLKGEHEADVVVVGGGFAGLSTALHVAEAGLSVILLEAETPGWGASGRNGGQVNPGLKLNPEELIQNYGEDLGQRMLKRTGASGELVFDLIKRHGIDCASAQCGWIRAAHSPRTLAVLQDVGRQWHESGAAVDPLTKGDVEDLLGAPGYIGGIIDRRGGNLHPLNFALGLAMAAHKAGARLSSESRAHSVQDHGDHVVVTTDTAQVRATRAVLCTNAYTGDLAEPLGKSVVPVTSVQVATAPLSDNVAKSILPQGHSPTDSRRLLLYFRKDAEGRFVMGGRGAVGDDAILKRHAALRELSVKLYPQLAEVEWKHAWGGNVAMTQNHMPGLYRLSERVVAGIGFNGRGVGMATCMGTILADWAEGMPEAELDFPITTPKPIPFHSFRNLGVGFTVAVFRLLDRFKL